MQNEMKKIIRLIDEVASVLMKNGSKELDVKIKRENDETIITIVDYNSKYTEEEIGELKDILNIQRQCEVEGFYWELMGDEAQGDELFLVGSMIDKADVDMIDNNLHIKMFRRCLVKHKKSK